jgi:transketolase
MPIIDSTTGKVVRDYTVDQLKDAATLMRGYDLVALCAAGSGHAGGTLSIMDIAAAVYLKVAAHDPNHPNWPDRDRVIWSTGHKAPSLYLGLALAGFCSVDDVVTLRKLYSPFQGHLHRFARPGAQHRGGTRAGGQAGPPVSHHLLHHG